MDATVWQIISIVGYSLSGLLFIAAIVLFFKLNIRAIIGDLSGKTAARQIQEIRERNTVTGNKRHKPDAFNLERGTLTEVTAGRTGGKSGKVGKTAQALAHASKRLDGKATSRSEPLENVGAGDVRRPFRAGDTSRPAALEQTAEYVRTEGLLFHQESDSGRTAVFAEDTMVLAENGVSAATEVLAENGVSTATEVLAENGMSAATEVLVENGVSTATEVLIENERSTAIEVLIENERSTAIEFLAEKERSTATMVLAENEMSTATDVLVDGKMPTATGVLSQGKEIPCKGTDLLFEGTQIQAGTEVLSEDELYPTAELEEKEATPAVEFKIVKDIKVIHTTEVI